MKRTIRVLLYITSYLISFLLAFGAVAIFNHAAGGLFDKPAILFFIAGAVAVPACVFFVTPSLRALYYRRARHHSASLSLSKTIRTYSKKMPASGAAVFFIRDDESLTVVNASPGFWHLIGYANPAVHRSRTVSLASLIHKDDVDFVRGIILGTDLTIPQIDFRMTLHDSRTVWCRLCGIKEELPHSNSVVSNCVAIDISDFMNTERDLNLEKERYRLLLSNLSSAIWEYNVKSDRLYMLNRHASDGKFQEVEDYRTSLISSGEVHPDYIETYLQLCRDLRSHADNINVELRLKNFSGNYAWYTVSGKPLRDEHGEIISYIGQVKKLKNRKENERSSVKDYDALTHLNSRYAFEGLVNTLIHNDGHPQNGALFVLNVDRFQRINNSLGRLFGDALLIELSEALKSLFPESSVFSRISGDEFAVYVNNYPSEEKIFELAGAVCNCVKHCFISTDKSEIVTCCVGVALYPTHGSTFEQLFYLADSALIVAKHRGPGNYYVYSNVIEHQLADLSREHEHHLESSVKTSTSLSFNDDTLLSQVVDILFESRELSSSINLIISLIGRRFKLDRAYVIELSGDMEHGTITYHWAPETTTPINPQNMIMPIAEARDHIFCSSRDEYFLCEDMPSFADQRRDIADITREYNVHSMLQCPILDGNDLLGCFSYVICREDDSFSSEDVRQIIMITKIIIGYLVRLRTKQDVDRITYRDRLTGVMNFNAFQIELNDRLRSSSERGYAIVYSDIDRFKFINEKYGYSAGDSILCKVAEIYDQALGEGEFYARVNADKFIALMKCSNMLELDKRINAIHEQINNISKTETSSYHLPVRTGVYSVRPDDSSTSAIIDRANLARKSVKNIHINTIAYFNETMKSRLSRQKDIEEAMSDALLREEFVIYYQPKFSLSNNSLAGAEALVRWKRPNSSKLLRPDEFIPIFEDNGFVVELDFYVLERVCRKLRRDIDRGMAVLPISVNFSRTHLNTDNLVKRLRDCLDRYRIPPNLIEIEITESALTENEGYLIDVIGDLHGIGLVVSMDDFGSGFSSLNLLKKLPVDVLKIDKNFFAGDSATERERCIIENVVNMARSLGIHVVSEGVETLEQATFLRSINCDLAQGYLYSPPLDEQSFDLAYLHP